MEVPAWSLLNVLVVLIYKAGLPSKVYRERFATDTAYVPISKETENFTLDLSPICIISGKFDAIQFDITKNSIT